MSSADFSFPKEYRLLQRRDFVRVAHKGLKLAGKYLYIDYQKTSKAYSRLGITATKRYGNAPERNRFKRLVREAYRLLRHRLPEGLDLVVKPRTYAKEASMQVIQKELEGLLGHVAKAGDAQ